MRNKIPFLLCIPDNKLAQIIEDLNDYNREVHNTGFSMPDYLTEKQEVHYDYQGEDLEEISKTMSQVPSRSRG